MLAAACAVGVGCCFAAPIGGRVPPAHTSHPCSRVLVERPAGPCPERPSLPGGGQGPAPRGPAGMGEAVPLDGVPAGRRRKGGAGAVLPEV